jgi:3D (Asp-Asp-Asp) domain-containing protein
VKPPVPWHAHIHPWTFVAVLLVALVVRDIHNTLTWDDRKLGQTRADLREQQQHVDYLSHLITDLYVDVALLKSRTEQPRVSRSTGRHPLVSAGRAATPQRSRRWSVTAYCATGHRTASGVWPRIGMAATLDRSIPFGTRLSVPGIGVVTVTDRIGHGSDLDLYLGSGAACEHAAREWGRRHLTVEVVA